MVGGGAMPIERERTAMGNVVLKGYDTAQVCQNGHITNWQAEADPAVNKKFCTKCGAATITACTECNQPIRGHRHTGRVLGYVPAPQHAAAYCYGCGSPHPWTQARIEALGEMLTLVNGLSAPDQSTALALVPDLAVETPKSGLATIRWQSILGKAGDATGKFIRDTLVGVASEVTAKALGLKQ